MRKSTRCVATKQRALRSAQNLDTLDIEQLKGRTGDGAHVHLIDIDRDGGFVVVVEVVERNTAQREVGIVAFGRRCTERHARCLSDDVDAVLKAELFDLLATECSHGDADVLHALLALLGSDDDLFHDLRCVDYARRAHTKRQEQKDRSDTHEDSPAVIH
ncbi:MAG: hypothetical protein HC809_07055 [Gammaproteobacteria bacterium]|nr:hypothetical protein [Gammaproteobacteria bacterium]